jgi:hypothetical protein
VDFSGLTFNPDSSRYEGDTIKVFVPNGKTYYVIPFIIGIDPEARPNGGGLSCYCQCACSDYKCEWPCEGVGPSDEALSCWGLCELCYFESDGCPGSVGWSRVSNVGGFAIIEANGVNVVQ